MSRFIQNEGQELSFRAISMTLLVKYKSVAVSYHTRMESQKRGKLVQKASRRTGGDSKFKSSLLESFNVFNLQIDPVLSGVFDHPKTVVGSGISGIDLAKSQNSCRRGNCQLRHFGARGGIGKPILLSLKN
jgi:hypothetical protein